MQSERFQLGSYWLDRRADSPAWYICWCEKQGKRYRTRRHSTGEPDIERAKVKLAEHFLQHTTLKDEQPENIPLSFVLDRYFEQHGRNLPSRETIAAALAKWKAYWLDATVAELTIERQEAFVAWLRDYPVSRGSRAKTLSAGTVARTVNVGRAALTRAYKRHDLKSVPYVIVVADDARCDRTLTVDELAALFNAADEHLWRYLLLAVGTAARPAAVLELSPAAVDFEHDRINLLPAGRRQNKKRRPIVPICATLRQWLRLWTSREALVHQGKRGRVVTLDRLITWRGKPLAKIRQGFGRLKANAGIVDPLVTPKTIRHTVATWLAAQRVPEWEREVFLGHRTPGSATTARYVHLDPEYLRSAANAIDELFRRIALLVERPILIGVGSIRQTG